MCKYRVENTTDHLSTERSESQVTDGRSPYFPWGRIGDRQHGRRSVRPSSDPVGVELRKGVDQFESDILDREGDLVDPCDQGFGLLGQYGSGRQADGMDFAPIPEENDAEHDSAVAAVGSIAEADGDAEMVPVPLDVPQPVAEVPGSHVGRASDGLAGLGVSIRAQLGRRSGAGQDQGKCEVQDPYRRALPGSPASGLLPRLRFY